MKPIVQFYKELLTDLGVTVDKDGALLIPAGEEGKFKRLTVNVKGSDNKRRNLPMYLPTDENIHRDEDGTRILFHPACESPLRGNSEVLNKIITMVNLKLYASSMGVVDQLIRVASDAKAQKSVPYQTIELITSIPAPTKGVIGHWERLAKTIDGRRRTTYSLKLLRNTEIAGVRYTRVARIHSPLLESDDLYGVKMSKVAMDVIKRAFDAVAGTDPIEKGSMSPTAPGFTAVMEAYNEFMVRVSKASKALGKADKSGFKYSGRWARKLNKLHDWYMNDFYVQYPGNIGTGKLGNEAEEQQSKPEPDITIVEDTTAPEPVVQVEEDAPEGVKTFKVPSAPVQQSMPQQPAPAAYPPPGHPPAPVYGQPQGYPPQQPQGYPQQQQMYRDPRTGQMMPKGNATPTPSPYPPQQPQGYPPQGYPQQPGYPPAMGGQMNPVSQYPTIPGYTGPVAGEGGIVYYTNQNTGVVIDGPTLMQQLQQRNQAQAAQATAQPVGHDVMGNPIYG